MKVDKPKETEIAYPEWPVKEPLTVEVGRVWFDATERRDAGEWVWELSAIPSVSREAIEVEVRLTRQREDYYTKKRRGHPEIRFSEFIRGNKRSAKDWQEFCREQYERAKREAGEAQRRYQDRSEGGF